MTVAETNTLIDRRGPDQDFNHSYSYGKATAGKQVLSPNGYSDATGAGKTRVSTRDGMSGGSAVGQQQVQKSSASFVDYEIAPTFGTISGGQPEARMAEAKLIKKGEPTVR